MLLAEVFLPQVGSRLLASRIPRRTQQRNSVAPPPLRVGGKSSQLTDLSEREELFTERLTFSRQRGAGGCAEQLVQHFPRYCCFHSIDPAKIPMSCRMREVTGTAKKLSCCAAYIHLYGPEAELKLVRSCADLDLLYKK